jgi:2-isopropylmalate synthase
MQDKETEIKTESIEKITIFDTTLRDGEQSPGATMNMSEKIAIAHQLAKMNVDVIEAGFPISSRHDFDAVSTIAREVKGPTIAALARCIKGDIDAAAESTKHSQRPRIHVFIATSPIHMKYQVKKTPEEVIRMAKWGVEYARQFVQDVEFSAEDATRSDTEFLSKVIKEVIASGATTVNIPDTVGWCSPWEYEKIIRQIKRIVPSQVIVSTHCHNDLGMAVANSIAGVVNGARQIECSINGIGERAGNAALEEVVVAFRTKKSMGFATGVVTEDIYRTSQMVSAATGIHVQRNKAIVGENAFSHKAGIHQNGMISCANTYEIINPKEVGRKTEFVLGKHSGKHAVNEIIKNQGFEVSPEQLDRIVDAVKAMDEQKKRVTFGDIIATAKAVVSNREV